MSTASSTTEAIRLAVITRIASETVLKPCVHFGGESVSSEIPQADAPECVHLLETLFVHRSDTFSRQQKDGSYNRVSAPITAKVLEDHLTGDITIGVYQIDPATMTVKWLCFDFDGEDRIELKGLLGGVRSSAITLGVPKEAMLVEDSGRRGYHLWLFFAQPAPLVFARRFGENILAGAKLGGEIKTKGSIELFPKQDQLPADGFGNLVKLPLGIHQKSGGRGQFLTPDVFEEASWVMLKRVRPWAPTQDLINSLTKVEVTHPSREPLVVGDLPCWIKISCGEISEGSRHDAGLALARHLRDQGLSLEAAKAVMAKWWERLPQPPGRPRSKFDILKATEDSYNRKYGVGCKTIKKRWPELCDPNCPLLKRKEEKLEKPEPAVEIPEKLKGTTLEGFKKIVKKWLYIDKRDDEVIDVIYAAALDRDLPGEPVWLFVIGPAGATKTELLRQLDGPSFYTASTITAHTLITGLRDRNARDLLPELDNKVLILKDFTTTLTDEDQLTQILAQLREAYDGYLEMVFGSGVGKKSYRSTFGLIAGVTPIIDAYYTVQNLLGERFLKIRMRTKSRKKSVEKARGNVGKEAEMRKELRLAGAALLENARKRINKNLKIPPGIEKKMLALAMFTATARSGVHRDRMHYMTVLPEPEVGTRLVKQLKKLIILLAAIRGKNRVTKEEFNTIVRVACDTVPKKRLNMLEAFFNAQCDEPDGRFTSRAISQAVKAPTATTTEELENLWALGLIIRYGDEKNFTWALEPTTIDVWKDSGIEAYLALRNHAYIDTKTIKGTKSRQQRNVNTLIPGGLRSSNFCDYCHAPATVTSKSGTKLCDACAEKYAGDL